MKRFKKSGDADFIRAAVPDQQVAGGDLLRGDNLRPDGIDGRSAAKDFLRLQIAMALYVFCRKLTDYFQGTFHNDEFCVQLRQFDRFTFGDVKPFHAAFLRFRFTRFGFKLSVLVLKVTERVSNSPRTRML